MRNPSYLQATRSSSGVAAPEPAAPAAFSRTGDVPSHLAADEAPRYDQEMVAALLRECRDAGATDIHFKVPGRPRLRVDGSLVPTPYPPLVPEATFQIAQVILGLAGRELPLATVTDQELGFGISRVGRFRAHLYRQRGSLGITVHRIVLDVPRLADLGGGPEVAAAAWSHPGFAIVTGQGRRMELLAALIAEYNASRAGHLVALEQPMEYLHRDEKAAIAQREINVDTPSFVAGLEAALVGDADAVVTTDIPDADAADLMLRIAETGRRVLGGLAGCPASAAAERFVRLFPPHRETEVRERMAGVWKGVLHFDGKRAVAIPARG